MTSLPHGLLAEVQNLARRYDVERVVLFGSRARGDAHLRSDIDLAIYTNPSFDKIGCLAADIEELPTLLKIDLVFMSDAIGTSMMESIAREGVAIHERSGGEA